LPKIPPFLQEINKVEEPKEEKYFWQTLILTWTFVLKIINEGFFYILYMYVTLCYANILLYPVSLFVISIFNALDTRFCKAFTNADL